jgi:uncharacterized protein DUF4129
MKGIRCIRWRLLFFLLVASYLRAQEHAPLTLSDYGARLQDYENKIGALSSRPQDGPGLRASIQDVLRVQTPRGEIKVQTTFLKDGLERFLKAGPSAKPKILASLTERLRSLRSESVLYQQPGRADDATRGRLNQILSASEFSKVRGPTELEILEQRISAWIGQLLRKISPKVPDVNNAGQWFVWCMIALASSVFAVWLYRVSRERMVETRREILHFIPSDRDWRQWLFDARQSAARGEWRDAIHFGFWAAVSRLESQGIWRPDKTRTPREYLSVIPATSPAKTSFAAITRKFEASWYGSRPTTDADFQQFTAELERLGCN